MYLYNAVTGGLVCASCDPSGARPVGPSGLRQLAGASFVEYRPRQLLEDGTLFFDSHDALVANASGGQENVYEYEGGRVYALSDVAGAHESFLMDASGKEEGGGEGGNVFFATADHLLEGQDTGNNLVVFDARVNGGFPAPVSVEPCANGEECLPTQTPQPDIYGPPPTATFVGPGNPTPPPASSPAAVVKPTKKTVKCKKGLVKNKQNKCVKKPKKKKTKAKKTSNRKGRA